MKLIKTDLLRGEILTPSGIKFMKEQAGESDWFYNLTGLKIDAFWTPDEKNIRQVEQLVLYGMVQRINDPNNSCLQPEAKPGMRFSDEGIREILEQYLSYHRHYAGLLIQNERFVYFNSFPKEDIEQGFIEDEWGSSMMVMDGGSDYWQALVSMDREDSVCLNINGEA